MNWPLYLRLSAIMGLEYAVWGAWMPVLAVRLLGPLKMTGKQTGWIYATLPLACIFAPLASGYLADSLFNAEWIILISHAIGAVLLFVAAKQTKFWGMFWTMLVYSIFYTGTLPLVNSMLFQQYPDEQVQAWVFFWAPVAWAVTCFLLTGIRQIRKMGGDGPDSLYLAAILSILMVVACLCQEPLKPAALGNPIIEAMGMLKNANYLIFILVQLAVSGMVQFYFLGTGQCLQDRGVEGKYISGIMGIAQAVQAAATFLLLGLLISKIGFQWTLAIGALCWTTLFTGYTLSQRSGWMVLVQPFHGLAYVFFMIGGQIFVRRDGSQRNQCIVAIADLHGHQRHRPVPGHPARRLRDGEELGGRQIPVVKNLDGSARNHAGRGHCPCGGLQGARPSRVSEREAG